jgi:hypothetical protein
MVAVIGVVFVVHRRYGGKHKPHDALKELKLRFARSSFLLAARVGPTGLVYAVDPSVEALANAASRTSLRSSPMRRTSLCRACRSTRRAL